MKELIAIFIGVTIHRMYSGARNGSFYREAMFPETEYGKMRFGCLAAMWVVTMVSVWLLESVPPGWGYLPFAPWLWTCISGVGLLGSFGLSVRATWFGIKTKVKVLDDLHAVTWAEQGLLMIGLLCWAPCWQLALALLLSVWPAALMQKVLVNLMQERLWWENGTDDPTGRTWGLPSLGISVPRTTQKFRLWASLACLVGVALLSLCSCRGGGKAPEISLIQEPSKIEGVVVVHDTVFVKAKSPPKKKCRRAVTVGYWEGFSLIIPNTEGLILRDSLKADTALNLSRLENDTARNY